MLRDANRFHGHPLFAFERMITFWRQTLHGCLWEPASADWAVVCDAHNRSPNLSFQKRDRPGAS